MSEKLLMFISTFLLCLSVIELCGADLTQQEIEGTLPNGAAGGNEPGTSTPHSRRTNGADGVETSPTDRQLLKSGTGGKQKRRNEEDEQIEAIMFRMFENNLLANLDFETLPRPVNASQPSVPDYMFSLYQHLKVDKVQHRGFQPPETTHSEDASDIIHETIRGYHVISENWQRPGLRYLVFNTTSQPLKENITYVELVLHLCSTSVELHANSRKAKKSEGTAQYLNITISMVTKRRRRHNRLHLRLPVENNRSYLLINITKMVRRSIAQRQTILNYSIQTSSQGNSSVQQPCQFSGSSREKRPLLVVYENIHPFLESGDNKFRRKRDAPTEQDTTTGHEDADASTLPSIEISTVVNWTDWDGNYTNSSDPILPALSDLSLPTVSYDTNATNTSSSSTSYPITCHLRRWYVNFSEMNWHHVILQPPGYYANYCWGLCPTFLENINATNHAYLRSKFMLFHRLDPDIPKPFCTPIRMTPVTLLYLDKYGVIIAKKFHEMVAAECSCM